MIARENAEPAGIKWKRSVHPKLGTKISNRMFACYGFRLQMRLRREVRLKTLVDAAHAFQVNRICGGFGQSIGGCFGQELSWIVFTLFPDFGIEISEDALAVASPAPPVIPGQTLQRD